MARVVTDFLDEAVERFPNKIACVDENRSITYAALREEAYQICAAILKRGLFHMPIAIYLDKGIECIAAMLGVAYSGNYYTVLNTKMPSLQAREIVTFFNPGLVISNAKKVEALDGIAAEKLLFEELPSNTIDMQAIESRKNEVRGADVICVIFTSGSTGKPKGVVISHHSVIADVYACIEGYQLTTEERYGNLSPLCWVVSLSDIYFSLKTRGTLYLVPDELFMSPLKLMKYLEHNSITMFVSTPSIMALVTQLNLWREIDISCLKKVVFGGESMSGKVLRDWQQHLPETIFINGYGSTEVIDLCTYYVVDHVVSPDEVIPLGKAAQNYELLVLGDDNRPHSYGELCVRGEQLAYGYYNDWEETDRKFTQNPLEPNFRDIIYRTGDYVEYSDEHGLILVGRKDHQIELHGHRIELGEIEAAALKAEEVCECCCLFDNEKERLILVYTGSYSEREVMSYLKERLAPYMRPALYIRVEEMPRNANSKIDRKVVMELYGSKEGKS